MFKGEQLENTNKKWINAYGIHSSNDSPENGLQNQTNSSIVERLINFIDLSGEYYFGKNFPNTSLNISSVKSKTFVECVFENLDTLTVFRAESGSFTHCKFPKLHTVKIKDCSESTFLSCHFPFHLKNELISKHFINSTFHPDYFIDLSKMSKNEEVFPEEQNIYDEDLHINEEQDKCGIFKSLSFLNRPFAYIILAGTASFLLSRIQRNNNS